MHYRNLWSLASTIQVNKTEIIGRQSIWSEQVIHGTTENYCRNIHCRNFSIEQLPIISWWRWFWMFIFYREGSIILMMKYYIWNIRSVQSLDTNCQKNRHKFHLHWIWCIIDMTHYWFFFEVLSHAIQKSRGERNCRIRDWV